jgi:hypothetical protein
MQNQLEQMINGKKTRKKALLKGPLTVMSFRHILYRRHFCGQLLGAVKLRRADPANLRMYPQLTP